MYCVERKKLIDRLFDKAQEKGDDCLATIKYITRQYEFKY